MSLLASILTLVNKIFSRKYHYLVVMVLLTAFYLIFYNSRFWKVAFIDTILSSDLPLHFKILAPIAIVLLTFSVFMILFSYKYVIKPAFIFLFITGAMAAYSCDRLGVIYDVAMIQNFAQTNIAEATSYINVSSALYFIILGIIPSIIFYKVKIYYPSFIKSNLQRVCCILVALVACGSIVLTNYQQFAFIGRENKAIPKHFMPSSYIAAVITYTYNTHLVKPLPFEKQGLDAKVISTTSKPKLGFVVVGETARAANYSLLGYSRQTNRYTAKEEIFNFAKVSSCGTNTAHSVPCMLTNLTRSNYSDAKARARDSVFDVTNRAGINTIWLENDGGCKGMCDRIEHIIINPQEHKGQCNGSTCFDEVFLKYAKDIASKAHDDTIVVFHFIGSHGPKYYERYPQEFKVFTPECNQADVENCSLEEVVNSYDNTIAYTDYVNYRLIEILKENADKFATSFLYVSDHGESLGENGLFLHGTPYAIAPSEQTHIPMQLWMPKTTSDELKLDIQCLFDVAKNHELSHDNVYHTILGLMQVHTAEYVKELDILDKCKMAR